MVYSYAVSIDNLQIVSSFGGESLALPATIQDTRLQVQRPTEEANMLHYAAAQTNQTEQLTSMVDSGLLVTGALVVGIATGVAASAYTASKIRSRETPYKRALREANEAAANTIVDHTISHKGRELILSGLFANVQIETNPDVTDMQVSINGKQRFLSDIDVAPDGRALRLTSTKKYTDTPLPDKWWVKLMARGLNIDYETADKRDLLKLVATLPTGSSLAVKGIEGYVSARGEYGKTSIETIYAHEVDVDSVTGANIKASSNSQVRIGSVDGPVAIDAGYQSSVTVKAGKATSLCANLNSASGLDFDATADNLKLTAGYKSSAHITRASGDVRMTLDSNSQAVVDSGNATSVRIDAGYKSSGTFNGHARKATLNLSSNSGIQLGSVTNLEAQLGHRSNANVLLGDITNATVQAGSNSELDIKGTVHNGSIVAAYGSRVSAGRFGPAVHIDANQSSRIIETR